MPPMPHSESLLSNSRASQILNTVSNLQQKYGDTILDKLHHLDLHGGNKNINQTTSSATSALDREAQHLAAVGHDATTAGTELARDLRVTGEAGINQLSTSL